MIVAQPLVVVASDLLVVVRKLHLDVAVATILLVKMNVVTVTMIDAIVIVLEVQKIEIVR